MNNNSFEGTVNLTNLPPRIRWLYLSFNKFYGSLDCTELPKSLEVFTIQYTDIDANFPPESPFSE
eukprot:CAMPEP_0201523696 /NCGR_PEP_ID=MMETSP0161_2-20130828/20796_1 /ASSEMBLY_ACC=CAM_ASM_000251 /TAXON_ID=180227 /ORGANISM="Neoparamoeba aestuarina, Strain SoJaBio B1-5/56/2" /LENGTH=64 /DNA_ID=CAMNT_0047922889 /DNA_START=166 /DNA_END=360 /DNA_ORIENTATION=-